MRGLVETARQREPQQLLAAGLRNRRAAATSRSTQARPLGGQNR